MGPKEALTRACLNSALMAYLLSKGASPNADLMGTASVYALTEAKFTAFSKGNKLIHATALQIALHDLTGFVKVSGQKCRSTHAPSTVCLSFVNGQQEFCQFVVCSLGQRECKRQ